MKNKVLVLVGVVAAVAWVVNVARQDDAPISSSASQASVEVNWLTDFKAAQEQARNENKPLLVDFTGSDWCPPCILLEKQVFSQPEFAEYARRNLVVVKVDFPRRKPLSREQQQANEQLAARYGIRAFPTILMMDADGGVKGQLGYTFGGPSRFVAKIGDILSSS